MEEIGHQHLKSIINILNLSPRQTVSNIRHQHRCKTEIVSSKIVLFFNEKFETNHNKINNGDLTFDIYSKVT